MAYSHALSMEGRYFIMKTKLEIIEETANFYNSENRAFNPFTSDCEYLADNGNMCAVGRCILPEKLEYINVEYDGGSLPYDAFPKILDNFKPDYRIDDVDFWMDLQRLHDAHYHWNENGLTDQGKEYVQHLKRVHKD